jgi:hypothetical protein
MTTRISAATGNWGTAGTWLAVDATSLLNSESANTALTTSYVESSTFTPGAITIDGIAVKIASVSGSPTGTISVRLALAGATVTGTEVTIDVADLPQCNTTDLAGGWVLFKFSSTLLVAATAYTVSAKTSSASMVNLFRNATAANWSRMLRTTTTGAPAAGDDMVVIGEHTGSGTGNSFTVTMDSTAATDFGSNTTSAVTPALAVGKRGTLLFGSTASTNYILRLSGYCVIYANGTFNVGTTGTPIPRNGSAVLEFDCAADLDFGLTVRNLGTFTAQGLSRTSGKNIVSCKLNTDEAVNSTSLGVDTDTGWLDNDAIAIATTTRTPTQCEVGALNGDAGASALTVDGFAGAGGGLAFAHGGTAPVVAEIILLTRNVRIRSVSSTAMSRIAFNATAIVDIDWTEIYYCGAGATPGIAIATTSGSCAISYSSLHDFDGGGVVVYGSTSDNYTLQYCGLYSIGVVESSQAGIQNVATTGTAWVLDNIISMRCYSAGAFGTLDLADLGGTVSNITVTGAALVGFSSNDVNAALATLTLTNMTAHGNGGDGISFRSSGVFIGAFAGTNTSWRNGGAGLSGGGTYDATVANLTLFGNTTNNISFSGGNGAVTFTSMVSAGDSTFATTNGLTMTAATTLSITINTGDFSPTTGIYVAHTTDINPATTGRTNARVIGNNVKLGGGTQVTAAPSFIAGQGVQITRLGQVDGANKSWFRLGTVEADATTYHTAAPSQKLTPISATQKLQSGLASSVCDDSTTLTISVWVRKDAAYNGNQPRLMLQANAAMGTADTDAVLATMSAAVSTWQQLTATTNSALDNGVFSFYVDCDGTAGYINVDDWSVTSP